MKTNEILTLLQAGYTKADIDLLESLETPTVNTSNALESLEPVAAEPAPNQADSGNGPDVMETINELSESVKALRDTITAMQKQNIQNADSGKDPNRRMTTKEALTSFFGSSERSQKE